ncbi:hypothetical protein B7494_g7157 [Chlorociboria aeruginascens]|nr:hypothetical protein B7494_g7157 [Chlorociboria aeruginascens]
MNRNISSTAVGDEVPVMIADSTPGSATSIGRSDPRSKSGKIAEIDDISKNLGVMKVEPDDTKTVFLGGAHWVSIMCEIDEFKNHLLCSFPSLEHEALESRNSKSENAHISSLLRGTTAPVNREEILSNLPSKAVADILVSRFFFDHESTHNFPHAPTFMKEYGKHWKDPTQTSIVWLALLLMISHHGLLSYQQSEEDSFQDGFDVHQVGDRYKIWAIKSLVASDYTQPVIDTIQVLMLYIEAEWITSQDVEIELSLVLGITIRLAQRMGMHRDPKNHPGLTPFQGEVRRRLWAAVYLTDILYSIQLSLPITIQQDEYDCAMPRNIYDNEFGEDTIELPLSRPYTEVTPISHTIAKYKMSVELGKIIKLSESKEPFSHDIIQRCRHDLEMARKTLSPQLYPGSMGNTNNTTSKDNGLAIGIDRMYQLSLCMLYRSFLRRARVDSAFLEYRRSCIDAAMIILDYQVIYYTDLSFGHTDSIKKRHLIILSTRDFFLAGMAIAMDLHYGTQAGLCDASNDVTIWGFDRRSAMINALERSIKFWRMCKDYSHEAAKAHAMFSFVLGKVKTALSTNMEDIGSSTNNPHMFDEETASLPSTGLNLPGVGDNFGDFDWICKTNPNSEPQFNGVVIGGKVPMGSAAHGYGWKVYN